MSCTLCDGQGQYNISTNNEAEAEYYQEAYDRLQQAKFELEQAKNDIELFTNSSIDFPYTDNLKICDKAISDLYKKIPKLEIEISELENVLK